jgi:transcriptional regulator with XRE-family HTH domain
MAGKKLELGDTGRVVAQNVQRLRVSLGMNFTDLSERLVKLGRDVSPLAVRRIEEGARRVDVDDLTTLAVALEVSPVTLLMPDGDDANERVPVTGFPDGVVAANALLWISGSYPASKEKGWAQFTVRSWPRWRIQQILDIRLPLMTEDGSSAGEVLLEPLDLNVADSDGDD